MRRERMERKQRKEEERKERRKRGIFIWSRPPEKGDKKEREQGAHLEIFAVDTDVTNLGSLA